MADDKGAPSSGGGGSSWGAFEVILVILLAIALVSRLQGEDFKPLAVDEDKSDTQTKCGVLIRKPRPLQKIEDTFVHVAGKTTACGWKTSDTVTLYAQLVDNKNIPVSDQEYIATNNIDFYGYAFFDVTIDIDHTPDEGIGYLIIQPTNSNGVKARQLNARIPVQFTGSEYDEDEYDSNNEEEDFWD